MSTLYIKPFTKPFSSQSLTLPGSKSLTNRALLLGLLARGKGKLYNPLMSQDTQMMLNALSVLGAEYQWNENEKYLVVDSSREVLAQAFFDVGNAGTVARFLPAALATLSTGEYEFKGSREMLKRPMEPLLGVLKGHGARIVYSGEQGHFPFILKPHGLKGGYIALDPSRSSQFVSALLMAVPYARQDVTIELKERSVSHPFINMTCRLMKVFGVDVVEEGNRYFISINQVYRWPEGGVDIEADMTAASYFSALSIAVGGCLIIENGAMDGVQGDAVFIDLLREQGLIQVDSSEKGLGLISTPNRRAFVYDFKDISDTFLTLAALSPLLDGQTVIKGISHTRGQETDRIEAVADALALLGQSVDVGEDFISIIGNKQSMQRKTQSEPVCIKTWNDHRMAMSFGVLGSHDLHEDGRPWLALDNAACCGKTYPDFFKTLENLR